MVLGIAMVGELQMGVILTNLPQIVKMNQLIA
jgi:hypothetical protein